MSDSGIRLRHNVRHALLSFSIILVGLAGRSVLDKILALRGGPELVATWAQLQSVADLVSGVALAGIGNGLVALVAQSEGPDGRRILFRSALGHAIAVSSPMILLIAVSPGNLIHWLTGGMLPPGLLISGAIIGAITVVAGLLSSLWLGEGRQDRVLLLSAAMTAPVVAAAIWMGAGIGAQGLAIAQCLAGLLMVTGAMFLFRASLWMHSDGPRALKPIRNQLLRYLPAGIAIGILSPASLLLARGIVAGALSPHDAGVMQALWRSSEWITGMAAGVLAVWFFPKLSASHGSPGFQGELLRALATVLLPAAAAISVLAFFQREILATMFDGTFIASDRAARLFFLGDCVRIGSWVFLYALFAMRRTVLIAVGELFSLPLFALLLHFYSAGLSLERVGLLYLLTYLGYFAFNVTATIRGIKAGFAT